MFEESVGCGPGQENDGECDRNESRPLRSEPARAQGKGRRREDDDSDYDDDDDYRAVVVVQCVAFLARDATGGEGRLRTR